MLERLLSKSAQRLCTSVLIAFICWAVWGTMTNTGLAGQLNMLQAAFLFQGVYYPKLTVVIIALLALLVAYPIALLWDFVTRQGMFAQGPEVLEEVKP